MDSININSKCKVILTKKGAEWINEYHQKELNFYFNIFKQYQVDIDMNKVFPTKLKEGDTIECPVWELIKKFGDYFNKGEVDAPFIGNDINIIN